MAAFLSFKQSLFDRTKMSYKNKIVLITGASSGIGAATAIKFAEEGANLAIVGRNEDKLNIVSNQCEAAGFKPLVILADISQDENIKRVINTTIKHFGTLDILINNAGMPCVVSFLDENAIEGFDKTIATNLRAAVYLSHLAAPYLIKTKGNIVNVSSITGIQLLLEENFAYDTSKAALDHFTRAIAFELASKGVRVNSVNPGLVRTDIVQNVGVDKSDQGAFWDSLVKTSPLGKLAEPEEIADLILFVASEKASSITGSSFVADNGAMLVPSVGNIKSQNA